MVNKIVNKIVNKLVLLFVLSVMVLFAGCSSNDPVITEVKVVDLKYNSDKADLGYYLDIKYAMDEKLNTPSSGIMRVTFDEDGVTKELEWGFMPGEQNNKMKMGLGYTDYIIGHKITGKIEMIQGTKVLDTKTFEAVYNE